MDFASLYSHHIPTTSSRKMPKNSEIDRMPAFILIE